MTERVAIVTGASGGIGHAVAVRLGQAGMAVAVHYAGNRDRAQAVADEVAAAGGRAMVVSADVADEEQIAAMFDQVETKFGGIDVVVHTAGIMLLSPLTELKFDDFDRMHRTNVRGTFLHRQPAGRPAGAKRRRHHQLLHFGHQDRLDRVHRVCRDQGGGRRDDPDPGQGDARPGRDRERRRARSHRHPAFPRRQAARSHRPPEVDAATGTPGRTRRHCGGRRLPGRAGAVGERPSRLRQWRSGLDMSYRSHSRHGASTGLGVLMVRALADPKHSV